MFGIRPDCDRAVSGPARVRLRLRNQSAEIREVTVPASVSRARLVDGHAILCARPAPGVVVGAETLQVQRYASGELLVRLRLRAAVGGGRVPYGRLLNVRADISGVTLQGLPVRGAPPLPSTAKLRLRVSDCEKARKGADDPAALRVALSTKRGPYLVYAHTDAEFHNALQGYINDHCGASG